MTTRIFALKKDHDMLFDQVQDLRRSYIILEYLAKIMRGYEDAQRKQTILFEGLEKRVTTIDTRLTSIEKESKSHSKELETITSTLDIVAQEVMNHSKEFYQLHKKLAQFEERFSAHDAQFVSINEKFVTIDQRFDAMEAKLDKIIAHLGI